MSAPTPTGFEPRTNAGRALLETLDMVAWFDEDTDYPATIRAIEAEALEGVAERVRALQHDVRSLMATQREQVVLFPDDDKASFHEGQAYAYEEVDCRIAAVLTLLSTEDES